MNLFNARETLAASFRNQRSKRIPFTAGQVFGLTIIESLPDAEERWRQCASYVEASDADR